MSTSPEYATFHFHALHHADQPLLLPNAWDVISAAALAGAGYAAVGTTSLGVAAAHGYPDGRGLAEVRDATLALALRLNGRLPCPYTVDVEGDSAAVPAKWVILRPSWRRPGPPG